MSLHPFLGLAETDRIHWLARFFDAPTASERPYGLRFPLLRPDVSPADWLTDQFQSAQGVAGEQDKIRRAVVELIRIAAARERLADPEQVLGLLLEVAGPCGFTDVGEVLRGWARAGHFRAARYRLGGEEIPLRQKIWSIVIGWQLTEGLEAALSRDLEEPEEESAQLCFAALGRLAPAAAIERLPSTFDWPEPYRKEVLRQFFVNLGARQALDPRLRRAWTSCFLGFQGHEARYFVALNQEALPRFLSTVGIGCEYRQLAAKSFSATLKAFKEPVPPLQVRIGRKEMAPVLKSLDDEIAKYTNRWAA